MSDQSLKVIVPSFNRAEICRDNTYRLFPDATILVHDQEAFDLYQELMPDADLIKTDPNTPLALIHI